MKSNIAVLYARKMPEQVDALEPRFQEAIGEASESRESLLDRMMAKAGLRRSDPHSTWRKAFSVKNKLWDDVGIEYSHRRATRCG